MGRTKRLWWATWPGALLFGLISLALVAPSIIASVLFVSLRGDDSAGLDYAVEGPGLLPRLLAVILGVVSLALPAFTVRWARKKWAGYLLLGLCVSSVIFFIGLFMLGIL